MTDSEEECLHDVDDVLCRSLKAERGEKSHDAPPKRKRKRASSDAVSDAARPAGESSGLSKHKRQRRTPSIASPNSMFTKYAAARRASYRKKLRTMQPETVGCTHDQRGDRVWNEYKNTFTQLRQNASARRTDTNPSDTTPCIPSIGWEEIEEARCDFFAANRGLRGAERRHMQAQIAEHCYLDAAKALIMARRETEESLRMALASVHPYRDLHRLRLANTLRQSVVDTIAIASLSNTVALSHASATAIANAKVSLFSRKKLACRFNREVTVCRVNGTGDSATSGEGSPLRLRRVKPRGKFSVALPRTTKALDGPQASVPDPGVSPRMRVVFSQLEAITTAAAKSIADKRARTPQQTRRYSAGGKTKPVMA